MNITEKIYGDNGLYNKLREIKHDTFQLKESYQSVIPLNLYLTWSNKELPPKMQENVNKLKRDNPEFNVQVFDDSQRREFIKNNFSNDILVAYDTLVPGAYKADLWRFCVLYINGGIYLDIKVNCTNNFKLIALTEREHLCIDMPGLWKENMFGICNAYMVFKAKNELLMNVINKISENVKNRDYAFSFLYISGPGVLAEEYIKILNRDKDTMESKLNELDMAMYNQEIFFNNTLVMNYYKEYAVELHSHAKTKHYVELYKLKQIYGENNESFINIKEKFENIGEKYDLINSENFITLITFLFITFILLMIIKNYFQIK